jgi:ABC-type transport system substrate-binding protein
METPQAHLHVIQGVRRRDLLKAGLAVEATMSAGLLARPQALWAAEAGQPKRGGILRVRGWDPPHFDPHLTPNVRTHTTLSFVYSRLVRYKVGVEIPLDTFRIEPDVAARWETPDDTTYVFYLCHGVHWLHKSPVNGRELVAEDVQFTFDRFLTEKGNPFRYMLEPVDRVEVVDRYTVQFRLKEPYVWLLDVLANKMWIIAREVVEHYGDLKKPESAIGTGPFLLERYEPSVKTVFTRHPNYFLTGLPWVDGVEWLVLNDPSTGLAMYRTGQLDCGPQGLWNVRQHDLESLKVKRYVHATSHTPHERSPSSVRSYFASIFRCGKAFAFGCTGGICVHTGYYHVVLYRWTRCDPCPRCPWSAARRRGAVSREGAPDRAAQSRPSSCWT